MALDKYAEFDKEKAMARFKELKAKGGSFTLADIVKDEQGRLPKVNTDIKNDVSIDLDDESLEFLKKYHNMAMQIAKYQVSNIDDIETQEGVRKGFTYGEYSIFFEDDTVLVETQNDEAHELAIYEIEEL